MSGFRILLRKIRKNETGATAVEFAILGSVFFMLMFATIEFGLVMFSKVVIESAVNQAGRFTAIGSSAGCTDRACAVKNLIATKTAGLINPKSVRITATVVGGAAKAGTPDICLDNPNDPYPVNCNVGINNDGNAGYQQTGGVDTNNAGVIGGSGALVEIRVTYLWQVLFPMMRSAFKSQGLDGAEKTGFYTITSSTVIKNEPFN